MENDFTPLDSTSLAEGNDIRMYVKVFFSDASQVACDASQSNYKQTCSAAIFGPTSLPYLCTDRRRGRRRHGSRRRGPSAETETSGGRGGRGGGCSGRSSEDEPPATAARAFAASPTAAVTAGAAVAPNSPLLVLIAPPKANPPRPERVLTLKFNLIII